MRHKMRHPKGVLTIRRQLNRSDKHFMKMHKKSQICIIRNASSDVIVTNSDINYTDDALKQRLADLFDIHVDNFADIDRFPSYKGWLMGVTVGGYATDDTNVEYDSFDDIAVWRCRTEYTTDEIYAVTLEFVDDVKGRIRRETKYMTVTI